jgi:hypothetical protein
MHICTLVPDSTYPHVVHNMWGLISIKGQDVADDEGWWKVRWKYRGEGGAGECQSSGLPRRDNAGSWIRSSETSTSTSLGEYGPGVYSRL